MTLRSRTKTILSHQDTRKRGVAMHCSFGPLDVTPVVLGFHYETHYGPNLRMGS